MTRAPDSTKHKSSDKHGSGAGYHDRPAGGKDCRGTEGEGRLQGRAGEVQEADEDSYIMIEETDVSTGKNVKVIPQERMSERTVLAGTR